MVFYNDTKHDRFCKSVTEIKDHAKNFPNAPRILIFPFLICWKLNYPTTCRSSGRKSLATPSAIGRKFGSKEKIQ